MSDQRHLHRKTLRLWAPSGLAGAAAGTAVALLLEATLTTSAFSAPGTRLPVEPGGRAPAVTSSDREAPTAYCFMRRHGWADAVAGPIPTCRAHRSGAGQDAGGLQARARLQRDEVLCMRVPSRHENGNPHYCVVTLAAP